MDWIETTATVVQAIAVTGAGYAAWRSLTTWRYEMTARRRAELAEHTMAMFYEARDRIAWVRVPASFGEEGSSRPIEPNETEHDTKNKNALYVPIERLSRHAEFWGQFDAGRYAFMAVFGEEATEPFNSVSEIRSQVRLSARMLIMTYGKVDENREERKAQVDKWESAIGWRLTEKDEIAQLMDSAVSKIEEVCKPAITGKP